MAWDMVAFIALVEITLAIENLKTDIKSCLNRSNPYSVKKNCVTVQTKLKSPTKSSPRLSSDAGNALSTLPRVPAS
jgi:hypothetical protein